MYRSEQNEYNGSWGPAQQQMEPSSWRNMPRVQPPQSPRRPTAFPVPGEQYYNPPLPNIPPTKPHNQMDSRKICQIALAEFLGTAIILYVGCWGCDAITFGLAILTAVQAFGHISGAHFNPAVTLAALVMNKVELRMVPFYLASQFVGAIAGYAVLYLTVIQLDDVDREVHCLTDITVLEGKAVAIEIICTMILVLMMCGFWDDENENHNETVSLKVALSFIGVILVSAKSTGASFNTARSVAPAIFANYWENHWIYWVGPNVGGVCGAIVYKFLLKDRPWQK